MIDNFLMVIVVVFGIVLLGAFIVGLIVDIRDDGGKGGRV